MSRQGVIVAVGGRAALGIELPETLVLEEPAVGRRRVKRRTKVRARNVITASAEFIVATFRSEQGEGEGIKVIIVVPIVHILRAARHGPRETGSGGSSAGSALRSATVNENLLPPPRLDSTPMVPPMACTSLPVIACARWVKHFC